MGFDPVDFIGFLLSGGSGDRYNAAGLENGKRFGIGPDFTISFDAVDTDDLSDQHNILYRWRTIQ